MKYPTLLFAMAVFCVAGPAAGEESFQAALQRGTAAHPSLYSFSDLYRLAVSGPAPDLWVLQPSEAPVRTAAAPLSAQFSVAETPQPQPALLLLSGMALAMWVARRRLGYAL